MVLFICGVSIWKFCLEVLSESFALKPWLETLNKYVVFILLFGSFDLKPWLEALSGNFK